MVKTTVYLSSDLKRELHDLALETGQSEAQVIRAALTDVVKKRRRYPKPRLPLSNRGLGRPDAALNADKYLAAGFGR